MFRIFGNSPGALVTPPHLHTNTCFLLSFPSFPFCASLYRISVTSQIWEQLSDIGETFLFLFLFHSIQTLSETGASSTLYLQTFTVGATRQGMDWVCMSENIQKLELGSFGLVLSSPSLVGDPADRRKSLLHSSVCSHQKTKQWTGLKIILHPGLGRLSRDSQDRPERQQESTACLGEIVRFEGQGPHLSYSLYPRPWQSLRAQSIIVKE